MMKFSLAVAVSALLEVINGPLISYFSELGLSLPLMIAGLSGGFVKWSNEKNTSFTKLLARMITGMIVANYFGAWVAELSGIPLFVSGCTTGFVGISIMKFAQDKIVISQNANNNDNDINSS